MRWTSWRRDLVFTVLGALLASAVLVPIGWFMRRDFLGVVEILVDRTEELRKCHEELRNR